MKYIYPPLLKEKYLKDYQRYELKEHHLKITQPL